MGLSDGEGENKDDGPAAADWDKSSHASSSSSSSASSNKSRSSQKSKNSKSTNSSGGSAKSAPKAAARDEELIEIGELDGLPVPMPPEAVDPPPEAEADHTCSPTMRSPPGPPGTTVAERPRLPTPSLTSLPPTATLPASLPTSLPRPNPINPMMQRPMMVNPMVMNSMMMHGMPGMPPMMQPRMMGVPGPGAGPQMPGMPSRPGLASQPQKLHMAPPPGMSMQTPGMQAMMQPMQPPKAMPPAPTLCSMAATNMAAANLTSRNNEYETTPGTSNLRPTAPKAEGQAVDPLVRRKSYKEKLVKLYSQVNPNRITDIDGLLDKYAGREDKLLLSVLDKYDITAVKKTKKDNAKDVDLRAGAPTTDPIILGDSPRKGQKRSACSSSPKNKKMTAGDKIRDFYKKQIKKVYKEHNPEKLSSLDALLDKYRGNERDLFHGICDKYDVRPPE